MFSNDGIGKFSLSGNYSSSAQGKSCEIARHWKWKPNSVSTSWRISGSFAASSYSTSGTYLVFNVGDANFVCDLKAQEVIVMLLKI